MNDHGIPAAGLVRQEFELPSGLSVGPIVAHEMEEVPAGLPGLRADSSGSPANEVVQDRDEDLVADVGPVIAHRRMVEALVGAVNDLREYGLGLVVGAGYRSLDAHCRSEAGRSKDWLTHPLGAHNRGAAIDVAPYLLESGAPAGPPSPLDRALGAMTPVYDDMGDRMATVDRMAVAFSANGLVNDSCEWWHFSLRYWRGYRAFGAPARALLASRWACELVIGDRR